MYYAYFINLITSELKISHQPSDNPQGNEWKQISEEDYYFYANLLETMENGQ